VAGSNNATANFSLILIVNSFKNWSIFDEVKAYKKVSFLGQFCIDIGDRLCRKCEPHAYSLSWQTVFVSA